jgi:octaheme c-type cytochrome (tetrathionate reductase family)
MRVSTVIFFFRQKITLKSRGWLLSVLLFLTGISGAIHAEEPITKTGISEYSSIHKTQQQSQQEKITDENKSTTDHSKLKELEGPFSNGPEVTKACLGCHNKAGHQFKKNKHWTWEYKDTETGQMLGKKHLVNTFCTNARGNEGMCAQCHAGYGWKDDSFDFDNEENIDCLACHDSSGKYYKLPPTKGNKACAVMFEGKKPIDWVKTAQSVDMPGRANCGSCHFYGGGGDNVKHGDLSSILLSPDKEVDVHMDSEGLNFACITCHIGEGHDWAGSRYVMDVAGKKDIPKPGMEREVASCKSCHGETPHPYTSVAGIKLNTHTKKVACETCHIPSFARGGVATKTDWDWRTMGKLKNGEGYNEEGYIQGNGEPRHTYKSIKGSFKYAENVKPTYAWFDGKMSYLTIDSTFDPAKTPVEVNSFKGSHDDPDSRIYPFKAMRTIQPYDKGNNTLVYMELWGDTDTALWGNYDFSKAIKVGMEKYNIPYSGEYDFIPTVSYWPINHMVAPEEDALACSECHAKEGRLAHLEGFYMPGKGDNKMLDLIGIFAVLGTLGGMLGHGAMRAIATRRRNKS